MDWLKSTWGGAGACCLSAIVFWLCFFPANWGFLGWVALVPWLLALQVASPRKRIVLSAVFGLVFFGIALNWMRVADYRMIATWVLLAVWSSLFLILTGYLAGRLADRYPRLGWALAFPLALIPLDWMRSMALEGFPWYYLGHTQHDWLELIQICDFAGVYALSFAVALVNGLLADGLIYQADRKSQETPLILMVKAGIALLLVGGFWIYGLNKIQPVEFVPGSEVAVLQANHPQAVRNPESSQKVLSDYRKLSDGAVRAGKPLILIWPETSVPSTIDITDMETDWRPSPVRPDRPSQLLGAATVITLPGKKEKLYNSSVLVDPTGSILIDRYDKIHRVPFGEYVPLVDLIPGMRMLAPYENDYSISSGEKLTRFPMPYGPPEMTFGAAICYESGDVDLFRQMAGADGKKPVDFFVNQSNDGWFHGTEEHDQHFLLLRFRAVETRRPVVRAVNMGISGWVDAYGRVLAPRLIKEFDFPAYQITDQSLPSDRWHEFKKNAFSMGGEIPVAGNPGVYVAWGDWFPLLCTIGLFGALILSKKAA